MPVSPPLAAAHKLMLHPSAVLATSCAAAEAAAQLASQPLFFHLSSARIAQFQADSLRVSPDLSSSCRLKVDLCEDTEREKAESRTYHLGGSTMRERSLTLDISPLSRSMKEYAIPFPVVASLGQGTGKLRLREICLCPLPGAPLAQQLRILEKVHTEIGKQLASKYGVIWDEFITRIVGW